MADYALTASEHTIRRTADGASIPDDPANRDYQEYLNWLALGNVPDPAPPPPPPPVDLNGLQTDVLFAHENRVRALEGKAPMPRARFKERYGL